MTAWVRQIASVCLSLALAAGASVALAVDGERVDLMVISGAGHPAHERFAPTYALLRSEADARGLTFELADFVGAGHAPEVGEGLELLAAAVAIRADLERAQPRAVMCLAFGCAVLAHVMAEEPDVTAGAEDVIFWAPPSFAKVWRTFAQSPDSLAEMNQNAAPMGFAFSPDFWRTYQPVEHSLPRAAHPNMRLACGDDDYWCEAGFPAYLASLADSGLAITVIPGAQHHVNAETSEEVRAAYVRFVFGE